MLEREPYTPERLQQRFGFTLEPGERCLNVWTRHWIILLRRAGWLLVLLGLILGGGWLWVRRMEPGERAIPEMLVVALGLLVLIYILYAYVDWRNDALVMTDKRLVHLERVILLLRSQRETGLDRVQNVRVSVPGPLGTLLRYGEVSIETAARGSDIVFGPIADPRKVQDTIMARVLKLREAFSEQRMHEVVQRARARSGGSQEEPGTPVAARRTRFRLLPPNPLIEGDRIVWHKHGIFLFARIFLPSVLLVGLVIVAVALFLPHRAPPTLWALWALGVAAVVFSIVWRYQVWLGDVYEISGDRIHDIYRSPFGLFGETRRSTDLGRIQNITYEQPGLLAMLFRYGNVRIQTAGAEDLTFDRVPNPADIQRMLYQQQERYRRRQQEQQWEEMVQLLRFYHEADRQPPAG
ncbi:MAG: PH domain-containing protein [Chloroflexia bacterium]